jgi:hypothetical protein
VTPRPPVHIDQAGAAGDKLRDHELVRVTFRTEGAGGAPLACRLRRLLKAALRAYGLRAVSVEPHNREVTP